MALTKQQIEQTGYKFYEAPARPGYNLEYQAVDPNKGVIQQVDSAYAEQLKALGIGFTFNDRSASGALGQYNSSGGNTVNEAFLQNSLNQIGARQQEQAEAARVQGLNSFIDQYRGSNTSIEIPTELDPTGLYTIHNGVFKTKSSAGAPNLANDPNQINVGTVAAPLYIPKGSAGEANIPNIGTNNTANAANAAADPALAAFNQQMVNASPGSQIMDPNTPTPNTPQVYRDANNNFYTVDAAGNRIHMDLAQFKQLGINADFVQPGSTVSLQQATTGQHGASDISALGPNISNDKLGAVTPIKVASPTDSSSSPDATVAGALANAQAVMTALTAEKTDAQNSADKLTKEIDSLIGQDTGRGAAQASEEEKRHIEELNKSIADVSKQILAKTAEFNTMNAQNENRAVTMSSITGAEANNRRLYAAEIGSLNALLLGLQGQASAAQEAANRAVDLKYSDIESQLDAKMKQLQLLAPRLSAEEKVRSEALNAYYDQQKQLVSDQKAADKKFSDVKIAALGQNMPLQVAQQAEALFNAGQTDAAYAAMAKYTGTVSLDKGGTGSSPSTTLFDSILQAEIDAGNAPEDAVFALQEEADRRGISIPYKDLAGFLSRAQSMTAAPGQVQAESPGIGSAIKSGFNKTVEQIYDVFSWF